MNARRGIADRILRVSLDSILVECAQAEGFPLAAGIDLDLAQAALPEHVARYDRWIAEGRQGAMQYLERGRDRRADPCIVMPGTKSIFCVAIPYQRTPGGASTAIEGPRYARYIRGQDYHEEIAAKLERVMTAVAQRMGPDADALKWKVCVDTSAVLERSWAAMAGLGWIGKNTLLINPKLGSYLFLAEVLLNFKTEQGPRPLPDYCGNCNRCLQGCPTSAITEPHSVDSNRCISYWTLEKRGELELDDSKKRAIGPWVAGCDICQEVCPFNLRPVKQELAAPGTTQSEKSVGAEHLHDWDALLCEDLEAYRTRVKGSALSRVKPAQFSRNLAIALTNTAHDLRTWGDDSAELQRFCKTLLPRVQQRLECELDPITRVEWVRCIAALQ